MALRAFSKFVSKPWFANVTPSKLRYLHPSPLPAGASLPGALTQLVALGCTVCSVSGGPVSVTPSSAHLSEPSPSLPPAFHLDCDCREGLHGHFHYFPDLREKHVYHIIVLL